MSLFDDDFYSSRVSRRKSRWVQEDLKKPMVLRSRSSWTKMRIALLSSTVSVAAAALLFGAVFHFDRSEGAAVKTVAVTPTSTADPYEKTIHAAAAVRPTVVSVLNEQYAVSAAGNGDGDAADKEEPKLQEAGVGSGVIFDKKDGKALLITNYHVIAGAVQVKVGMVDGTLRDATIVGSDQITDLAVLAIDDKGIDAVAELGQSSKLRNGEWVMAIGSPLGLDDSLAMGIVSKTKRVIPVSLNQDGNYDWEEEVIQVNAAINQGNSGGPLIDLDGKVVGINSMKIADVGVEGIGFAIPIDVAKPIIDSLIEYGKVKRPYLGVYTLDLDQYLAQQALSNKPPQDSLDPGSGGKSGKGNDDGGDDAAAGSDEGQAEDNPMDDIAAADTGLIVPDEVKDGVIVLEAVGPSKDAGLQFNDLIVKLDNTPIRSTMELRKYLYGSKEIGDSIEVTFYRDGEKQTTKLELAEKEPDDE